MKRKSFDRRGVFVGPSVLFVGLVAAAFGGCASQDGASSAASSNDAGVATALSDAGAVTVLRAHPLDTALLFPLPRTTSDDHLLRADASGAKGALVPGYAWSTLPALGSTRNADLFPMLRVVSANIDPCFPSGVDGAVDANGVSQCRKQLRLIFQPLHDDGTGQLTTDDVTVHTFYEMDASTFAQMTREIVNARGDASLGDEAIDVHPMMKNEGGAGPYTTAIRDIFLRHAGAANLAKVTFLALRGAGVGWQMGGVDFVGEKGTDMTVPATQITREEMTNAGTDGDFSAKVDPATKFSDGLGVLLRSADARKASKTDVESAFVQALRIDNPTTDLNPGTVDCASCHLATPTRLWVERNTDLEASSYPDSYANPRWNLDNHSETKEVSQSFRCFGYYGRKVAISQRTINEAAAVADFINDKVLSNATGVDQ